jgi:hypothetical protein
MNGLTNFTPGIPAWKGQLVEPSEVAVGGMVDSFDE